MFKVAQIDFSYPAATKPALKISDLELSAGEVVLLAGANGGGKSTLVKILSGITPRYGGGSLIGEVSFGGKPVKDLTLASTNFPIGLVLQEPENQVTGITVFEEATFGPRNLCLPQNEVIEQAEGALRACGILELIDDDESVFQLSGGQLQRLAIASLLAIKPEVMLLDEPAANLDPIGVHDLVKALESVKSGVKLLVIISHWLEPFLHLATRVIVMADGEVKLDVRPDQLGQHVEVLVNHGVDIPHGLQTSDVKEVVHLKRAPKSQAKKLFSARGVSFVYPGRSFPAVDRVSLEIRAGERLVILGPNGAGKSTLARIIAGLIEADGEIIKDRADVFMILQRPSLGFVGTSVVKELTWGLDQSEEKVREVMADFGLEELSNQPPLLLSGGEQRRLALATAFLAQPDLLILDEPTAGLDSSQVQVLGDQLETFPGAVVHITHDSRLLDSPDVRVLVLMAGKLVFDGFRREMSAELITSLGINLINPTVDRAIRERSDQIPFSPNELIGEQNDNL